jgi:hypothetical protein
MLSVKHAPVVVIIYSTKVLECEADSNHRKYSGVCHTDYAFCTNGFTGIPDTPEGVAIPCSAAQPVPVTDHVFSGQIGGHEGVGEVVAVGSGVKTFVKGSKAGIKYTADACLTCGMVFTESSHWELLLNISRSLHRRRRVFLCEGEDLRLLYARNFPAVLPDKCPIRNSYSGRI